MQEKGICRADRGCNSTSTADADARTQAGVLGFLLEDTPAECFAANLLRLRKLSRLSQRELAVRSRLNRTEISLLERGLRLPRLDTLIKLAAALEVSPMIWCRGPSGRLMRFGAGSSGNG